MKRFLLVILACAMMVSLVACSPAAAPAASEAASAEATKAPDASAAADSPASGGEKVKLGLSWFSMAEEYLAQIYTEFEKAIAEQGLTDKVEVVFLDCNMDAAKQNEQVDNLITQGVDAIIMIPFDREQQVPAVEAAAAAGIPMIELCASTAAQDLRTTYVGSDDTDSGRKLMDYLGEQAGGKGNIVVIHGPAGQNAEVMRHLGMQEVLEEKYPDMNVAAEKIADWDRAKSMSAMENILQSDMQVDVVFAEDDGMAMGALEAIEGSGKEGSIIIGGIDGIPDAFNAIKEGRLTCTVYQNAKAQAEKALEVALLAASGEKLEKLYDVPYELVTKDNVDDYIALTKS